MKRINKKEVDDMAEEKTEAKTTEGKDTTLALLAYVLTWISGLIVFVIAKDKFAKFHGMQAILLGVLGYALALVTLGIGLFLVWLYCLYIGIVHAYKGEMYKVPYIGEYAEKYAS